LIPNLIGPWVDVRSFAPPNYPLDGTQPWDTYIQDAIDYLVHHVLADVPPGSVGTLYLPPGKYPLQCPIRIRLIDNGAYQFCSVRITGDAPSYGSENFHGSALIAEFYDRPAVIVQAGRAVWIENLAIVGKNNWTAKFGANYTPEALYDDASFLADGVADDRRFAPYAGICIDPFCDPNVKKLYPNYEMYPCMEAEYLGSPGSSAISIQRCYITNFVVGIAISPNGIFNPPNPPPNFPPNVEITLNAENISIDDCFIGSTKSAIAVCQDQSRALSCRNLGVHSAKYAIDCRHYGLGSGDCPSIFNANIGWVKYLFNTYSFGSGAVFDGIYSEGSLSIGVLGGGGTYDGYVFNGCAFNLTYVGTRPSVGYHLANLARATFNACQIALGEWNVAGPAGPLWIIGGGPLSFHDCLLGAVNFPDNSPAIWVMEAPQRTSFDNTGVVYAPLGAMFSRVLSLDYVGTLVNHAVLPGCYIHQITDPMPDPPSPRWVASGLRQIQVGEVLGKPAFLSLHPSTGTATFTTKDLKTLGLIAPGDLISMTQPYPGAIEGYPGTPIAGMLGKVQAVEQVDDQLLGPFIVVTVGHVPDYVFTNPAPGPGIKLYMVGYPKVHQPTAGTTTSSDPTKVLLSPSLGPNAWLVGDRIRDDKHYIPPGAFVAAVGTDPKGALVSLTLSLPMDSPPPPDGTPLNLYDADVRVFTSTQVY